MFKQIEVQGLDSIGFEVHNKVSQEDYKNILIPALEKVLKTNAKARLLLKFDSDFTGDEPRALWEDIKLGLKHMDDFERIAIISDKSWINHLTTFFGGFIPCSVSEFKLNQVNNAKAWLNNGELGLDFKLDTITGNLKLHIHGPLNSMNFSALRQIVDNYLKENKRLNSIVIDFKQFPGWENIGSFVDHLTFVKDHHDKVDKVAIVSKSPIPSLVIPFANHFVKAKLKEFSFLEEEELNDWISH